MILEYIGGVKQESDSHLHIQTRVLQNQAEAYQHQYAKELWMTKRISLPVGSGICYSCIRKYPVSQDSKQALITDIGMYILVDEVKINVPKCTPYFLKWARTIEHAKKSSSRLTLPDKAAAEQDSDSSSSDTTEESDSDNSSSNSSSTADTVETINVNIEVDILFDL
ncbi:unnamed protein product [Mytilus edulis]|uniref:Uncharacterized protein n=1 Tax=Mytilus edulis TaxID=6550 RepID=A0A8S3PY97_MYTED|nr:unnamed protein product [Mytilus edulis]